MKLPNQTKSILRSENSRLTTSQIAPQGCNWWVCGGTAAACAAACASGVGTAACIACLGSAYDDCKDCF